MIKRQLAHLKKAKLASVEHFKKQKLEHQTHDTERFRINDNQVRTSDTYDTDDTNDTDDTKEVEEEGKTWFWHESANESESDTEDEDGGYSDPEGEESRTEKETPLLKQPKEIHWDKKREDNLQGFYGKGSLATLKKKKNAAKELKKEALKSYNIGTFWQCNCNLG